MFTENIDNSYKINNGIASPIWVIGSGGVNIQERPKSTPRPAQEHRRGSKGALRVAKSNPRAIKRSKH